jgi:hypothetical protein
MTAYVTPTHWLRLIRGTSTIAENFRLILAKQQSGAVLTVQDKLILQLGTQ